MKYDPDSEFNLLKKIAIDVGSAIVLILSIALVIRDYYGKIGQSQMLQGYPRFFVIAFIGVFCSVAYGILWNFADYRIFRWKFGPGGTDKLPSGFSAFILSLTLTLPLAFIPQIYEIISNNRILPDYHWLAITVAIIGGCIVHLLMYGINSIGFVGIRAHIMPPIGNIGIIRAILTEVIWAVADFGSIAFTYRVIVSFMSAEKTGIFALRVFSYSLVFAAGMAAFITILYPHSLEDPKWVQVRGFLSGILLPICLSLAMYL
jgi:hypothetical protein